MDTRTGSLVVIELKRREDWSAVMNQMGAYLAWVKANLAKNGQAVHGIICLDRGGSPLEAAARQMGIEVYEYDFRLVRKT